MPQDAAAALSSLLRDSTIDDHEEILKAANAAIKSNKDHVSSQQTRVVALLKLDRFDDALRAISDGGLKLETSCALEKAYALYKTGKLDDASATLRSADQNERSFRHMAAQVAYRAERFDEAREIYTRLLGENPAEEVNDLVINVKATGAQEAWQDASTADSFLDQQYDSFELCYNAACTAIASGALEHAARLLQRASILCDSSDELSEEDKQAEMRPILAQQAYVYARQGKQKEAISINQALSDTQDGEEDINLLIKNNVAALQNTTGNPFLLQRQVSAWDQPRQQAKLFKYQLEALKRNAAVADLKAQKARGVRDRTAGYLASTQLPSARSEVNIASALNAAAETQGLASREIVRRLQALSKKRPDDIGLVLTMAQVYIERKRNAAALALLETFLGRLENSDAANARDVRFSPGIVAIYVGLMRTQGRGASAKAELVKSATYWQSRPVSVAGSLLKEAGIELSRSSNENDLILAGATFQKLLDEQQGSAITAAGLVASLAPSKPASVQKYIADLPPIETLITGVDVDALVAAGVAVAPRPGPTNGAAASSKRPAPDAMGDRATKKRRRRPLPKSYVEGKAPDPERWLPLRDRSSYRPKGKKGKKKAAESTQGGMVKEEETLGLVGGGGVKVEKAPASGGNKKKKKGKK